MSLSFGSWISGITLLHSLGLRLEAAHTNFPTTPKQWAQGKPSETSFIYQHSTYTTWTRNFFHFLIRSCYFSWISILWCKPFSKPEIQIDYYPSEPPKLLPPREKKIIYSRCLKFEYNRKKSIHNVLVIFHIWMCMLDLF